MAVSVDGKTINLRNKLLLIGLLISIGFSTATYFLIQKMHNNNAKQHYQSLSKTIPDMIEREMDESSLTLQSLIEIIKNKPETRNAYLSKNQTALASTLHYIYDDLSEHALISEISIFDSNLNNVLSLTENGITNGRAISLPISPEKLKHQRYVSTLDIAYNENLVLSQISPWFIKDTLIGYVLISQDLKSILDEISLNSSSTILTLIDKAHINKQVWLKHDHDRSKAVTWEQFDDYAVLDISAYSAIDHARKIKLVPAALAVKENYISEIDGFNYITGHIPIFNAAQQHLGEIVFINNTTEFIAESKQFSNSLLLVMVLLAIVFIGLYSFVIQKIEHQQTALFNQLNYEIKQHRLTARDLLLAKETAEEASQAKSAFLSSMSHEFRTPLNSIIGFTQLLSLKEKELNKDDQEALSYIQESGQLLLDLINDILDLAKIESGTIELNMTAINVCDLLHSVAHLNQAIAEKSQISLHVSPLINSKLYIKADIQKIKQTLLNFISNAIKYNQENGSVFLNAIQSENNRIKLLVTDTGTGINQKALDQIFMPFNRLDKANSNIQGTGIGLTICKQLTELMGGTIGANQNDDGGMTFWVEFESA